MIHGEGRAKFGRHVGAVGSATASSLTDKAAHYQAGDAMKFNHVAILSGRGQGQYRLIVGNTRDTLIVDRPWAVIPDSSSKYLLAGMSVENTYLYNTTQSGSWLLLYKGNIANVVEGHETDRSAGIALFTNDESQQGKPELDTYIPLGWYNEIRNCLLDHTSVKFIFQTLGNNAAPRAKPDRQQSERLRIPRRLAQPQRFYGQPLCAGSAGLAGRASSSGQSPGHRPTIGSAGGSAGRRGLHLYRGQQLLPFARGSRRVRSLRPDLCDGKHLLAG